MSRSDLQVYNDRLFAYLKANPDYLPYILPESFYLFVRYAWPYINAGTFIDGYHIHAISEHLEALYKGDIRNLLMNIPVRHSKSTLASILFPAWLWLKEPELSILAITQKVPLTVRDSLEMRRLVQSQWFVNLQPRARLTNDQFAKTRYQNVSGGSRISTSVMGYKTGEGGDYQLVDDPQDVGDIMNPDKLAEVNSVLTSALATRIKDPNTTKRVVIAQRLHQADFSGHLIETQPDKWCHLVLPAEWDGVKRSTAIGWEEARTVPNQLLWPERFSQKDIDTLKAELGVEASGQLQQNPVTDDIAIFQEKWWDVTEVASSRLDITNSRVLNRVIAKYAFWDTALKDSEKNDFTARVVFGVLDDLSLILLKVDAWKVQSPDLVRLIGNSFSELERNHVFRDQIIEDKGSGTTAIQTLRNTLPEGLRDRIKEWLPRGSKSYRARQAAIYCSQNLIKFPLQVPGVTWLQDFEATLYQFPRVRHDDIIDAFTMGILYLEHFLRQAIVARQIKALEVGE